jgi:PAS domain S-box-containing protein
MTSTPAAEQAGHAGESFEKMVAKVKDYAIFLTDRHGIIQTWNKAAEVMKGYSAQEAIGSYLGMLYTEEDQQKDAARHNLQTAAQHGTHQEETWRRKKDGSRFWALVELIAIPDGAGGVRGFCKITRDLSARKKLQDEIVQEKERAQVTLAAIGDGVISLDAQGNVDFLNAKAQDLTGWTGNEAHGRPVTEVFRLSEEAAAVDREFHRLQGIQDDSQARQETPATLITRLGSRCMVEHRMSVIHGPGGRNAGAVIVFRDITLRRSAENRLKSADRRKDEFLAMLAHELRNPLAAMSAAADLLGMRKLDAAGIERTSAVVARQVRHMSGLIDDLLDVSRVTRGLVAIEEVPVDLKLVIADAIEQARPLIEKRMHTLTLETAAGPVAVLGDHKRLVQVVANIIGNSAKYTNRGGSIQLRLEADAQQAAMTVVDNGIGMSPDLLERAFQMFAQAEPSSDRAQGGLGIGLALVKSLVELHHGSVSAHSEGPGRGSTVRVLLPRHVPEAGPQEAAPEGTPAAHCPGSSRILVVDDNEDAAALIAEFLSAMGYEVLVEHEAGKGLARARQSSPDACLLDIGLPDFDGFSLARQLRTHPQTRDTMLIAITGFGQPQDIAKALAAGFDHHFVKPVDKDKLLTLLQQTRAPAADQA